MSIDVTSLDDPDEWNDLLEKTDCPSPFHLAEALDVFASRSGADLHRLVGYKGQEPVGLFPVFTTRKGPFAAAFSPPPDLKVPYLGPVGLNRTKLKQRRRERRNRRFVDACLDWLTETHDPAFTTLRTTPAYEDPRPFVWREFDLTPRYTYVVDLDRGPDDLLAAFSGDARRNVTDDYDVDYEVVEGDAESVERIHEQVAARHAAQGESFPIDAAFLRRLYEALPDGVVRPYVCLIDGAFEGGTINLEYGRLGVCWVGGAKTETELPVNDIADWQYCLDAMERGVTAYDFAGANDPRLSRYKAKFAPSLSTYYRAEKGSRSATAAARLYNRLR